MNPRRSLRAASLAALEALCSRPGLGLDPAALAPVGGGERGLPFVWLAFWKGLPRCAACGRLLRSGAYMRSDADTRRDPNTPSKLQTKKTSNPKSQK